MQEPSPIKQRGTDGVAQLGALLREVGLTRESVAEKLDISKHALDNWCVGHSSPSLLNLGCAIQILDKAGAAPESLRDLLLDGIVGLGLDEGVTDAYLGTSRLPRRNNAYAILLHHGGSDSQILLAAEMQSELLRAGREPVLLDCSALPALKRLYLEDIIPMLAPAGLIICQSAGRIDLDATAANLARLGIPTVYVEAAPNVMPRNAAFVTSDNEEMGYKAGQCVAQAGYEKVAIISFAESSSHRKRIDGFHRALASLAPHVKVSHTLVRPQRSYHDLEEIKVIAEIQRVMVQHRPNAVFVPSVSLALAMVNAVHSFATEDLASFTGVTIGTDSWQTQLLRSVSQPKFTIIDMPIDSLARKAVEMVLRLSEGQTSSGMDYPDVDHY